MKKDTRLTFRVNSNLKRRVESIAEREGQSVARICEAFLLAESYRAAQNFPAARRLYQRAQEAATIFDEALTEQLLARQLSLQNEFGKDFKTWLPATADLRRLPDLIRTVSQQRLDEMGRQTP